MIEHFTLYGNPVGWQRAGVNLRNGAHYTQEKTRIREQEIAYAYKMQRQSAEVHTGAVAITITIFFPKPKRPTRARPTVKPDYDNLAKLITDALNGIAYKDDAQIVDADIHKRYTEEKPRMEVLLNYDE